MVDWDQDGRLDLLVNSVNANLIRNAGHDLREAVGGHDAAGLGARGDCRRDGRDSPGELDGRDLTDSDPQMMTSGSAIRAGAYC